MSYRFFDVANTCSRRLFCRFECKIRSSGGQAEEVAHAMEESISGYSFLSPKGPGGEYVYNSLNSVWL